jgi:hypothetical protein
VGRQAVRGGDQRAGKFYAELTAELVAYADAHFRLDKPDKDGETDRQRLLAVESQTGKTPPELAEAPILASHLAGLWMFFCELSEARGGNGFGVNPIGWSEFHSWQQLTRTRLAPWEVRAIRAVDRVFIRVMGQKDGDRSRED